MAASAIATADESSEHHAGREVAASPSSAATGGAPSPTSPGAASAAGGAGQPPPPELSAGQDLLVWRREYNIRQREADWKRKQEELLTQKQVAWQIAHCERENRLTSAREQRVREELESRVYKRHIEIDRRYKERCRNVEIDKRKAAWEEKENARLVAMYQDAKEAKKVHEERLATEKERQCEVLRQDAADRADRRKRQEELNAKREENIRRKEAERLRKAAESARKLKTDAIARTNMVVDHFTARTLGSSPEVSGMLAREVNRGVHGHDGATPGSIL